MKRCHSWSAASAAESWRLRAAPEGYEQVNEFLSRAGVASTVLTINEINRGRYDLSARGSFTVVGDRVVNGDDLLVPRRAHDEPLSYSRMRVRWILPRSAALIYSGFGTGCRRSIRCEPSRVATR